MNGFNFKHTTCLTVSIKWCTLNAFRTKKLVPPSHVTSKQMWHILPLSPKQPKQDGQLMNQMRLSSDVQSICVFPWFQCSFTARREKSTTHQWKVPKCIKPQVCLKQRVESALGFPSSLKRMSSCVKDIESFGLNSPHWAHTLTGQSYLVWFSWSYQYLVIRTRCHFRVITCGDHSPTRKMQRTQTRTHMNPWCLTLKHA